jgi:hypothetical protein
MLNLLYHQTPKDERDHHDFKQRKEMSRRIERVLPPALQDISIKWRETEGQ